MSQLLSRAHSTVGAAKVLHNEGYYGDAVSRAYYATFYAAKAAILHAGKDAHTHKGVHMLFNSLYVKEGLVSAAVGKLLSRLFERRREADYDDGASITEEQSQEALDLASQFVEHVQKLLDG